MAEGRVQKLEDDVEKLSGTVDDLQANQFLSPTVISAIDSWTCALKDVLVEKGLLFEEEFTAALAAVEKRKSEASSEEYKQKILEDIELPAGVPEDIREHFEETKQKILDTPLGAPPDTVTH